MAVTATITKGDVIKLGLAKDYAILFGYFTTTGTYATNGFSFDLSNYFVATPNVVNVEPSGGYLFVYNYDTTIADALMKVFHVDAAHVHNLLAASGINSGSAANINVIGAKLTTASGVGAKTMTGAVLTSAAAAATEFTNGGTLTISTGVRFSAIGRIK